MILECMISLSYFSRNNNDTDMKLGAVTKLHKRNTTTAKIVMINSFRQIVLSLSVFQFMAKLEQFVSWIPDAWFVIPTFSLIITFLLTKNENRTK